ncbi:uncharacterized protein LOC143018176 isoform X2 [Oratosquilla oratoria]|uniref:uncharacterized protein LOC143018176 isoform X2 n=1 Tax=Oratosquilla oratoria TaxID=337810 RepID=UPI003F76C062
MSWYNLIYSFHKPLLLPYIQEYTFLIFCDHLICISSYAFIGTTAQFRDKESEDVRAIISSVPHETIQSFHDEHNPQHPASGADSNGQHVPPFELHENLNDELNLEHPASEINSNEQDVPPFEPLRNSKWVFMQLPC